MDRSQKAESVAQLNAVFNEVGVVVVTRNLGMTVAQSTALRTKIREAGATYKVAKNRLAKLAIQDTNYVGIDEMLTGPTAIANGCVGICSFDGTHPTAPIQAALFRDINRQFDLTSGVPEPATWAAMVLGFGLVGGALRRRPVRASMA